MIEGQIIVRHKDEPDTHETMMRQFARVTLQHPATRKGLLTVLQEVQREVNDIKRRGFCLKCLADEPPQKKLRLSKMNTCAECGLSQLCHD